jgi:hypothetical protein
MGNRNLSISDFVVAIRDKREPAVSGESGCLAKDLVLEIHRNNILSAGSNNQ